MQKKLFNLNISSLEERKRRFRTVRLSRVEVLICLLWDKDPVSRAIRFPSTFATQKQNVKL